MDYIGILDNLKRALQDYTQGDQKEVGLSEEQAVSALLGQVEILRDLLRDFDYSLWQTGTPAQRLTPIKSGADYVSSPDFQPKQKRLLDGVAGVTKAFTLAVPAQAALDLREEIAYFQTLKAALTKYTTITKEEKRTWTRCPAVGIQSCLLREILDIFGDSGDKLPDISIISDDFLAEVQGLPQKNLALEVLKRLLNDRIKARSKTNVVQAREFSERLQEALGRYQNRSFRYSRRYAELVEMAKDFNAASKRGEETRSFRGRIAFYDALEVNDTAVQVLGDDNLRLIARELVEAVKRNTSIDWTVRESVRAKLRVIVKRILRKYGYPPDKQQTATDTVLLQAEEYPRTGCFHKLAQNPVKNPHEYRPLPPASARHLQSILPSANTPRIH